VTLDLEAVAANAPYPVEAYEYRTRTPEEIRRWNP
jgi:hypothetical protein